MKLTLVVSVILAAGLLPGASAREGQSTAGLTAVTGARVVSFEDPGSKPGVSDAVILIKDGRVVLSGSPATVKQLKSGEGTNRRIAD